MKKATIEFQDDKLIVDGLVLTLNLIPQVFYELAHPDPRRWFSFERVDNALIVHVQYRDPAALDRNALEVTNGNYVTERGRSSEDAGEQGQEAANRRDEHQAN